MSDESSIQNETWVKSYWRPAMGWLYMIMCAFDFIIFPLIMIIIPIFTSLQYSEWKSLTLSNGGLIHVAFGTILGVAAYTRGLEKLAGKN
jgi:ABC-type Fe3+ transport system permease subunit